MACAARCAWSPRTVNLPPRRAMVTSSADSICRRFSSSAPHNRARRWLSTGSSLNSTGLLRIQQFTAQRMGDDGADAYVHERIDEPLRPGKVHYAVVGGAGAELPGSSFGYSFHKHALIRADHGLADLAELRVEEGLKPLQSFRLFVGGGGVREFRGRRAGARAVEEGEGTVEADLAHQLERGFEVGGGLAGEGDDEVRCEAEAGAGALQAPHDRAVLERGVAALHRGEHAVGPGLHRKVHVRRELLEHGVRVDPPLRELARVRGGVT